MNTLPSLISEDGPLERIGSALTSEFRSIMPDAGFSCFSGGGTVIVIGNYNFESLPKYGRCSIHLSICGDILELSISFENISREISNLLRDFNGVLKDGEYLYDIKDPDSLDRILVDFKSLADFLYSC